MSPVTLAKVLICFSLIYNFKIESQNCNIFFQNENTSIMNNKTTECSLKFHCSSFSLRIYTYHWRHQMKSLCFNLKRFLSKTVVSPTSRRLRFTYFSFEFLRIFFFLLFKIIRYFHSQKYETMYIQRCQGSIPLLSTLLSPGLNYLQLSCRYHP